MCPSWDCLIFFTNMSAPRLKKIPPGIGREKGERLAWPCKGSGQELSAFPFPVKVKTRDEEQKKGVKNWDERGKKSLPLQGKKCPRYISATPGKGEGALDFFALP